MKNILIVLGTRPEAIKLAPVIIELKKQNNIETLVCSTGQHREMLKQVLEIFQVKIDFDLDLMKPNQNLYDITSTSIFKFKIIFNKIKPDMVVVQGDTTTAFTASLAAFYKKIKVAHVEAGLRSYNVFSPYPEEANRRFISIMADLNFAPTKNSAKNLLDEGVDRKKIYVTGNTVVDSIINIKKQLNSLNIKKLKETTKDYLPEKFDNEKFILITLHRREKFGVELEKMLQAIKEIAIANPHYNFIYPVHLNPNVKMPVDKKLNNIDNIYLIPPQDYLSFIYMMSKCVMILTDSGGVQEECYIFKKPILVLRDVTERNEAIKAGYAFLVGSNPTKIKKYFNKIIKSIETHENLFKQPNPFGDGHSAIKIVKIIKQNLIK